MDKILIFFSNNEEALTSIGVILTFLVSVISLYFSVKNNKAVYYVNAVTKSRVEWIQKLKEYVSDYLKATFYIPHSIFLENYNIEEHIGEIERIKSLIVLHLNGDIDDKIITILNRIQKVYLDLFYLSTLKEKDFYEEDGMTLLKVDNEIVLNPKLAEMVIEYAELAIFNDALLFMEIERINNDRARLIAFSKLVLEELFKLEKEIQEQKFELLKLIKIYTKVEWRRVKTEATGKTYSKIKKKRYLEELIKNSNID